MSGVHFMIGSLLLVVAGPKHGWPRPVYHGRQFGRITRLVESTDGALIPFHRQLANLHESGRHGTIAIRGEFDASTSQDDPVNGSRTGRPAESGRADAVGKDKRTLSEHGPDRSILDPRRGRRNRLRNPFPTAPRSYSSSGKAWRHGRTGIRARPTLAQ